MRRPVLLADYNSPASQKAIEILNSKKIDFIEYDVSKFEESCCGELPTTITPSVFAQRVFSRGSKGWCNTLLLIGRNSRNRRAPTGDALRRAGPNTKGI